RFLAQGRPVCGVVNGDEISELDGDFFSPFKTRKTGYVFSQVKLLPPCNPSKVVAVGLNYRDHAHELGLAIPEEPVIFLKPATTIIGPGESVIYPGTSSRVDYEAELGVVVKDRTRNISPEEAPDHILGYTCANDITARDLQKKDGQWTRAKSFDTFCPVGPWIETDLDPGDLLIQSYLNGERRQSSRTSQLIFKVRELVSFISGIMTLEPGDFIITGTPAGIGPMKPGDEIEVRIEGIGSLKNRVRAE
ncbi:MAG TPA: fumarylacetoacetate hydrolase family protein, partial [Nitrospirota bacterium]|nr:fumarylacetoacetate hydrolase family protein [Nitrospirota bacterium]